MSVKIGSARIDENGRAHGGKAGDQTGKEVSTQSWYNSSKGWRVFRAKNPAVAEKIARCMQAACDNKHIGYDQYQRNTLYKESEKFGFDVAKVAVDCETDCSALVRVCCAFAGIMGLPAEFRTTNEPSNLLKTGAFVELAGSKYQAQSLYLGRGDILCTKIQGHTVVVLSNGSRFEGSVKPVSCELGDRVIAYGMEGADVKAMQEILITLGCDLGAWGADGDFGDCTEIALKAFQAAVGLEATGECDAETLKAMNTALENKDDKKISGDVCQVFVRIADGDCYVRTAANTSGKKLGVAHRGDILPYGGETSEEGWNLVEYKGQNGWVSGKYSHVI